MIQDVWTRLVEAIAPSAMDQLRPPVDFAALAKAEAELGVELPAVIRDWYQLTDGFADGAYLLGGVYRFLPLAEMIEASRLAPAVIVTDAEAFDFHTADEVARIIVAVARADDPDVERVSVCLDSDHPTVELWFRSGGVHELEEVVDTNLTVEEWLEECLDDAG